MIRRHLEFDQQFPGNHVAILLIVGQVVAVRDGHPAVDVAIKNGGLAIVVSHVNIFQPVEIFPSHELDIAFEEIGNAIVVRQQVDIVTISDVLPDDLFTF